MFKPKRQFDISVCQSLGKAKKKNLEKHLFYFLLFVEKCQNYWDFRKSLVDVSNET